MILTVDMLCIMGVGSILALIYCGILVFNNKYDGLLEPLNSKEYPLCETYNVGFYLINKIPRLIQNAHVRSKRQYIEILHGTKYADYYLELVAFIACICSVIFCVWIDSGTNCTCCYVCDGSCYLLLLRYFTKGESGEKDRGDFT